MVPNINSYYTSIDGEFLSGLYIEYYVKQAEKLVIKTPRSEGLGRMIGRKVLTDTPILQQTKYSSGEVFVDGGTRILVIDANAQAITVKSPRSGGAFILNRE